MWLSVVLLAAAPMLFAQTASAPSSAEQQAKDWLAAF
jgi:hypothetical protein